MEKRQPELDILRLLAMLAVIGLHICSGVQSSAVLLSADWLWAAVLRITWAVPIFLMISGGFLLQPERNLTGKTLWQTYALRLLTAYFFWSAIYQLYYFLCDLQSGRAPHWKGYLSGFFTGAYHMWYIWMLLGLYAITPILRKIAADGKLTRYYLLLAFAAQCGQYFLRYLPVVGSAAGQVLEQMHLDFVLGFSAYFLLGCCLRQWTPTTRQAIWLYLGGIAAGIAALAGDLWLTAAEGAAREHFTRYLSPLTMVQSAAVYVFFLREVPRLGILPRLSPLLESAARCGLGAYLCHALILELCRGSFLWDAVTALPGVGIPLLTVFAGALSILLASVLRQLPRVGKFIA